MDPITRQEQYLNAILTGNKSNLPTPITREEQYLYAIAMNGGGGGGGGTDDYEDLKHLPKINNVTLKGNKTLSDLGIEQIQVSTMPEASASLVGKIVQYIGATDTYTNGYFYKCVENDGVYSWEASDTQDMSALQPKAMQSSVTIGGQTQSTVEGAIEALALQDDGWTATAQVDSNNVVTFMGLSDAYGYALYTENVLVAVISVEKTGSGNNVTLAYTVSGAEVGTVCKLRMR